MGGGISILSDTDGEMILKYNKDVDLDKVIDIIQNRKVLAQNTISNLVAAEIAATGIDNRLINLTNDSSAISSTNNSNINNDIVNVDVTIVQPAEPVVSKLVKSPSTVADNKKVKSVKSKLISSSSERQLPSSSSSSLKKIPSLSPSSPRLFSSPIKVINNPTAFTSPISTKSKSGRRKSFGNYAELQNTSKKEGLPTVHSPTPLASSLAILTSPGNTI